MTKTIITIPPPKGAHLMPLTIHKSTLYKISHQYVTLPLGAEILCAREQRGEICIWYRCDPRQGGEERSFAIIGTGHPAPEPEHSKYISNVTLYGGAEVYHIFEILETKEPNHEQAHPLP